MGQEAVWHCAAFWVETQRVIGVTESKARVDKSVTDLQYVNLIHCLTQWQTRCHVGFVMLPDTHAGAVFFFAGNPELALLYAMCSYTAPFACVETESQANSDVQLIAVGFVIVDAKL